jgi:spore maturation protein CgeB
VRRAGGRFSLLFHDTHHRAVSDPDAIRTFDLSGYDGVLAFGETLSEIYRRWGWGDRVFTWHEAADTRLFRPPASPASGRGRVGAERRPGEGGNTDLSTEAPRSLSSARGSAASRPLPLKGGQRDGLVWIGNWGDEERSAELESFLLRPARTVGLSLNIYGVRYPEHALATLDRYGARYRGWLPNAKAPEIFARHLATVHVPRRFYVDVLPGIPTIRVFEALACGIPLVSAPWSDSEDLFRPGTDFLFARDEAEMGRHLAALRDDADLRAALVESGLATIRARHTCAHRAQELLAIVEGLAAPASETAAA